MTTATSSRFSFKLFLHLIRALFPRWDFFEQVAYTFELHIKRPGANFWKPLDFNQPRRPFSLFFNADCNVQLAQFNLIEHFVQDLHELQNRDEQLTKEISSDEISSLTTFKMLMSLLNAKLQTIEYSDDCIQFKITACSPTEQIDIYYSDWITLPNEVNQ